MASSKMLKEAIADAKAVRETAIANAKMALEEAFTPRLQSILSRKLQKEMEDSEEDQYGQEVNEENDTSTEIGKSDNKMPAAKSNTAQIKLDPETDKETATLGKELDGVEVVSEGDEFGDDENDTDEFSDATVEFGGDGTEGDEFGDAEGDEFGQDEDDLDLEAIIRELEAEADENGDGVTDDVTGATPEFEGEDGMEADDEFNPEAETTPTDFDPNAETAPTDDDEIDLDEILREMGYGDDEEGTEEAPVEDDETEKQLAIAHDDLKEAYSTIKSLRKTINEVNLLNAKLLFANKLFRGYNLTNEQKVKVVENLDRTSTVREVKLVYSTLCESMKFTGTLKKQQSVKRTISEGLASKPQQSTAPKKEIITEVDLMANRFKELAGITRK